MFRVPGEYSIFLLESPRFHYVHRHVEPEMNDIYVQDAMKLPRESRLAHVFHLSGGLSQRLNGLLWIVCLMTLLETDVNAHK